MRLLRRARWFVSAAASDREAVLRLTLRVPMTRNLRTLLQLAARMHEGAQAAEERDRDAPN